MPAFHHIIWRVPFFTSIMILCTLMVFAQQSTGELGGRVVDEFGALIVGATVTLTSASGAERRSTTNGEGIYVLSSVMPGKYTLKVTAPGFAIYENTDVEVSAKPRQQLNVKLSVTIGKQEVTVAPERSVSTDPENNASQIVLRDRDLDALPDDPDELAATLQALAGPATGPNGGEVFIDGFTGGRVPPKRSIREVRINQNTFSAEYEQVGFGRVEIFTKPGTDKFHTQGFFNFNDESLNSRNPFATVRAPHQSRLYGGNLSGPLIAGKASFFLDFERREIDDNALVNALILDPALNPLILNQEVLTPSRRLTFSPRVDYQLRRNNILIGRYTFTRSRFDNAGVGNFSLPSRAFSTSSTEHTMQLTETAVINQKLINEARFQFIHRHNGQNGDFSIPTIMVLDAFTGGGSQVGNASNNESRWEFQDYVTWVWGRHVLKAGGRLRGVHLTDVSQTNFGGTFTFTGGLAPQLDAHNQIIRSPDGQALLVPITSLERYRRTLLFQRQGLSPAETRALGGGATQLSIAGGNPVASVSQMDFGGFVQDDWRLHPNLTLGLGLRYEAQNNIQSPLNFAPRLTFAWSPMGRGTRPSKTVIRLGFGVFYDRFSESLTLPANRYNGSNQQQFIVSSDVPGNSAILDLFPQVPSITQLVGALTFPQTVQRVAPDLQSPYTLQSIVSIERQLPLTLTFSATFNSARALHLLRSRNINAPITGSFDPHIPVSGLRPFGNIGNIFEYESSGILRQNQLILTIRNRFNRKITLLANYALSKTDSDTDGPQTFPVNQYDLRGEYGRAALDIRHRFFLGGTIGAPWGISLNPFVVATSGRPFNIIVGRDTNGDTLFTERPAFASDLSKPSVVLTRLGAFDLNTTGQALIPRNFGTGPNLFSVNVRITKTFGFVNVNKAKANTPAQASGRQATTNTRNQSASSSPRSGQASNEKRYNLAVALQVQNLFNRTNAGTPVGNLSSPLFGQSLSLNPGLRFVGGVGGNVSPAANRRIEAQIRFSF